MPKKSKYPGLHVRVKKGKNGQVYTYYSYDMRSQGKPDIQLGTDRGDAIRQWQILKDGKTITKGRLMEAFDRWESEILPTYDLKKTRQDYGRHLEKLRPVFGMAAWHEVTLPILRQYLDKRSAKTQGNREMAVLSIIWHKAMLWGMTEKPWPATGIKGWKNAEKAREFEVTDALFNAVYAHADSMLRGCMDMSTATGMRITDAITVRVPVNGLMRHKHHKTGKWVEFEVGQSPTLQAMLDARPNVSSLMFLTTESGRPVTYAMLRKRWEKARTAAAESHPEMAAEIHAMYLRDMRKRAADLASDLEEASKLLQHSSKSTTEKHYRTKATRLKAVR